MHLRLHCSERGFHKLMKWLLSGTPSVYIKAGDDGNPYDNITPPALGFGNTCVRVAIALSPRYCTQPSLCAIISGQRICGSMYRKCAAGSGEMTVQSTRHLPSGGSADESRAAVAQSVEQRTENPRVASSILACGTTCGSSSAVEHRLAKARVAGSNPVFRSRLHKRVLCSAPVFFLQ